MLVVAYEDRPDSLVGLKLTLLGVRRHSPDLRVLAWVPDAPAAFREWAAGVGGIELRTSREGISSTGWGVKPAVLLAALDLAGGDRVTWIDSDIVASADVSPLLADATDDELVATEEYFWGHHQGSPARTTGLGLPVGRVFPATVNTGLVSVTDRHRELLEVWAELMNSPEYLAVQKLSALERPLHFWGDQETLTGLLGSERFAGVPVRQLRRGVDVAQCYGPSGLTVRERVALGGALPPLVHAMGTKPWSPLPDASSVTDRARRYWQALHAETGPYVEVARTYESELGEPAPWLHPRTLAGRGLTAATRRRPALRELPLAVPDTTQRWVRRRLGMGQLRAE